MTDKLDISKPETLEALKNIIKNGDISKNQNFLTYLIEDTAGKVPLDIIESVITANPLSIITKDTVGNLPIYYALKHKRIDIFSSFIRNCRPGEEAKNIISLVSDAMYYIFTLAGFNDTEKAGYLKIVNDIVTHSVVDKCLCNTATFLISGIISKTIRPSAYIQFLKYVPETIVDKKNNVSILESVTFVALLQASTDLEATQLVVENMKIDIANKNIRDFLEQVQKMKSTTRFNEEIIKYLNDKLQEIIEKSSKELESSVPKAKEKKQDQKQQALKQKQQALQKVKAEKEKQTNEAKIQAEIKLLSHTVTQMLQQPFSNEPPVVHGRHLDVLSRQNQERRTKSVIKNIKPFLPNAGNARENRQDPLHNQLPDNLQESLVPYLLRPKSRFGRKRSISLLLKRLRMDLQKVI